jgi:hypothetical protein
MKVSVSFTSRPLYPWRNSPRSPLDRLGGLQADRDAGEKRNIETSLVPAGNQTSSPPDSMASMNAEVVG